MRNYAYNVLRNVLYRRVVGLKFELKIDTMSTLRDSVMGYIKMQQNHDRIFFGFLFYSLFLTTGNKESESKYCHYILKINLKIAMC